MSRRIATLIAALIPVISLGVLATILTVPFVALGPGPTFNTLGDVDGKPVVAIEGTEVDPTAGNLNMTTVSVRDGLTIFEAMAYWASGRYGLVPRSEVYPPEKTREEIDESNQADFARSEDSAELAALRFLDYPITLQVDQVATDGPAADVLQAGDQLVSIAGTPVDSVPAVQGAVGSKAPGEQVAIVFRRDGIEQSATVTLAARPDDAEKGYLGITPVEEPDVPFTVDFNLADIGGPSAGLMFSLAVVDKLSPGELSDGQFVAGTGTIDSTGEVGGIGGIPYKLVAAREAGASAFLVPAGNCDEARQHAPEGLDLIKVDSLTAAVDALEARQAGQPTPTCG
ncbi:MAG TPA: PDZ domain-containing protein [Aldersonia sp.]